MAKRNHHLLPCLTTKKIVRHGTSSGTRHMNHLDLVASPYLFGSAACCLELWTKGIHILQVGKPLGDTNWLFNWLFPNHMIDPQAWLMTIIYCIHSQFESVRYCFVSILVRNIPWSPHYQPLSITYFFLLAQPPLLVLFWAVLQFFRTLGEEGHRACAVAGGPLFLYSQQRPLKNWNIRSTYR